MKEEYISLEVKKNEAQHQFELTINGSTAFIKYSETGNVIRLIHTESPPELAGKGVATALIEKTLHFIEQHHQLVQPSCPMVAGFIRKNPAWKRIVDPNFQGLNSL